MVPVLMLVFFSCPNHFLSNYTRIYRTSRVRCSRSNEEPTTSPSLSRLTNSIQNLKQKEKWYAEHL